MDALLAVREPMGYIDRVRKVIVLAILFVAACGPVRRNVAFPVETYAALPTTGTGAVVGQGFTSTVGGEARYCMGVTVTLNPMTPYSREFWEVSVLGDRQMEPGDPRQMPYLRSVKTDGEGRFEFSNVPPGAYYAYCPVVWYVGGQYQGGFAYGVIHVENGKTTKAILTR